MIATNRAVSITIASIMAITSLTGYCFAEDSIPSDVNVPAEESETTETLQIEEIQTLPEETEATCETSSAADFKQPLQEQTEETTTVDCQPESVTTETTPLHEDKTLDVLGSRPTTVKRQRVAPKTSTSKESIAVMTLIRKGGAAFDYRVAAGQALYQYDTLQGACANKGFAYLTLYNRTVEKCKIVKLNLKTLAIVKVSKPLPIYHANNLTYNTRKNVLVATCCQVKKKRAVTINPNTLRVISKKNIKLTKKVKGLPKKVRKKYKGFTAIAYNEKHNCYVGRLRYSNDVIIMNSKLKPKRYVKLQGKKTFLLNQGMESVGDYIYDVRSFKGKNKYCMVTVHTMSGKFVRQIKFPYGSEPGDELQCIFHDGSQYYAGIYHSTSQQNDTKKNHVKRYNRLYLLKM